VNSVTENKIYHFRVKNNLAGQRLDRFLTLQPALSSFTRNRLQKLIARGLVAVDNNSVKAGYRLRHNEQVYLSVPPPEPSELIPEFIDFKILYEDSDLIVISKPPDLVVHPAAGHSSGTLVNGLLYHCDNLSGINEEMRPGIVHRLDKDTSGIMVIAKNDYSHNHLVSQFKNRTIGKKYFAILDGNPDRDSGEVIKPIGRHPVQRKKMTIQPETGREAITLWKVIERFSSSQVFVELKIKTGRTHQIRVHMASLGTPVAGDKLYGRKNKAFEIGRQMLHSSQLIFEHPRKGEIMDLKAPLWPDMLKVLEHIRNE
jgi:23S rRNA pseudouridine1911/1915/1917 synthase